MAPTTPSSALNGVVIGLLSSFGSAVLIAVIFLVIYFFRYTASGRIFLDRIGRPGEYDDEQAFAREEAEALESMDDMQRTEYLRAKGNYPTPAAPSADRPLTSPQHSLTRTRPTPSRQTFRCPSTSPSKKRASPPGSLSPSSKSPTASSRPAPRLSSSTPNAPS